jgi:hypothetical protein
VYDRSGAGARANGTRTTKRHPMHLVHRNGRSVMSTERGHGSGPRADKGRSLAAEGACRAPGIRSLLLPYALSDCREPESVAFEAHLLSCDPCFEDLKCLDRAGSLLLHFLRPASPISERVRTALRKAAPSDARSDAARA